MPAKSKSNTSLPLLGGGVAVPPLGGGVAGSIKGCLAGSTSGGGGSRRGLDRLRNSNGLS